MNILNLIGRSAPLFQIDIGANEKALTNDVGSSSFLVLGGAGSIGQAVVKEIFKRNPKKLHVVDISENNLVELVRDIRSSFGYISGDFQTFALDIGSDEYDAFIEADGLFDYVLNLSALKHVRSEKDPFTLMRMIDVNIFNTIKTIEHSVRKGTKKYFCVSTDKAANPVNMMGASKRIMEMFLMHYSKKIDISTARFANVAFSDGSLLHGFNQRMEKQQPLVAPNDVRRYFVTPQESGELCLMSCVLGGNRDIFFPKLGGDLDLVSFSEIAEKYLIMRGFQPVFCKSEDEARSMMKSLPEQGKWPCFFSASDTTGEKDYEEFFMDHEELELGRFEGVGIVKNSALFDVNKLTTFTYRIGDMKAAKAWDKVELVNMFRELIPELSYQDKGKYLDSKM
jgi:UDP-N-acetylglucosamine 4,6-dehydratase